MKRDSYVTDNGTGQPLNSDATAVDPRLVGGAPVVVGGISSNEHIALRRREIARTSLSDERNFPPPSVEASL
jgi:hypothetical protein